LPGLWGMGRDTPRLEKTKDCFRFKPPGSHYSTRARARRGTLGEE
jgi:hypothetical protein